MLVGCKVCKRGECGKKKTLNKKSYLSDAAQTSVALSEGLGDFWW